MIACITVIFALALAMRSGLHAPAGDVFIALQPGSSLVKTMVEMERYQPSDYNFYATQTEDVGRNERPALRLLHASLELNKLPDLVNAILVTPGSAGAFSGVIEIYFLRMLTSTVVELAFENGALVSVDWGYLPG